MTHLIWIFCDRAWLQTQILSITPMLILVKILYTLTLYVKHTHLKVFSCHYCNYTVVPAPSIPLFLLLFPTVFLTHSLGILKGIPPPTLILGRSGSCVSWKRSHSTLCFSHNRPYHTIIYLLTTGVWVLRGYYNVLYPQEYIVHCLDKHLLNQWKPLRLRNYRGIWVCLGPTWKQPRVWEKYLTHRGLQVIWKLSQRNYVSESVVLLEMRWHQKLCCPYYWGTCEWR